MLFLSESSIHIFNHCTVAIFRFTDLTQAINEKVKIGCTGIAFTCLQATGQLLVRGQCSSPEANMKEKPVQPFNKIVKTIFS